MVIMNTLPLTYFCWKFWTVYCTYRDLPFVFMVGEAKIVCDHSHSDHKFPKWYTAKAIPPTVYNKLLHVCTDCIDENVIYNAGFYCTYVCRNNDNYNKLRVPLPYYPTGILQSLCSKLLCYSNKGNSINLNDLIIYLYSGING